MDEASVRRKGLKYRPHQRLPLHGSPSPLYSGTSEEMLLGGRQLYNFRRHLLKEDIPTEASAVSSRRIRQSVGKTGPHHGPAPRIWRTSVLITLFLCSAAPSGRPSCFATGIQRKAMPCRTMRSSSMTERAGPARNSGPRPTGPWTLQWHQRILQAGFRAPRCYGAPGQVATSVIASSRSTHRDLTLEVLYHT